jgi:hypothetical protein
LPRIKALLAEADRAFLMKGVGLLGEANGVLMNGHGLMLDGEG